MQEGEQRVMKSWTVDTMLLERPCNYYNKENLTTLWDGREICTLADIAAMPISDADIVWVGCRNHDRRNAFVTAVVVRAVQRCLLCGFPEVRCWATHWLDGTDRSIESAYNIMEKAVTDSNQLLVNIIQATHWLYDSQQYSGVL